MINSSKRIEHITQVKQTINKVVDKGSSIVIGFYKKLSLSKHGNRLPNENKIHYAAFKGFEALSRYSFTIGVIVGIAICAVTVAIIAVASIIPAALVSTVALPILGIANYVSNYTQNKKIQRIADKTIQNSIGAILASGLIGFSVSSAIVGLPGTTIAAISVLVSFIPPYLFRERTFFGQSLMQPNCTIGKIGDLIGKEEIKNQLNAVINSNRAVNRITLYDCDCNVDEEISFNLWKADSNEVKIARNRKLSSEELGNMQTYFRYVKVNAEEQRKILFIPKEIGNETISHYSSAKSDLNRILGDSNFTRNLNIQGGENLKKILNDSFNRDLIKKILPYKVNFTSVELNEEMLKQLKASFGNNYEVIFDENTKKTCVLQLKESHYLSNVYSLNN